MEQTITTYESNHLAWQKLQRGWDSPIMAYRIKSYKMRLVADISPSSLQRIQRILQYSYLSLSDTGENWFKTVYYMPRENLT